MLAKAGIFLSQEILRILLSLRYRIKVVGLESLSRQKSGILFLPNHPARIDALFIFAVLPSRFWIRPIVVEYISQIPFLHFFFRLFRGVSVPNFDTSVNSFKVMRAQKTLDKVEDGLEKRENFLFYPSGRMKKDTRETVGGSSGLYELVTRCPKASIVLVRITGLWGSSFSRALGKEAPDLGKALKHGILAVLKNLIFFTPRRKIVIEFEADPKGLPKGQGRLSLNRFIEEWYNKYPDENGNRHPQEPLQLVSYTVWKKEIPEVFKAEKKISSSTRSFSPINRDLIYSEIRRIVKNPNLKIEPDMTLSEDLGIDSLGHAELCSFLIRHFKVRAIAPQEISTVWDTIQIAENGRGPSTHPSHSGAAEVLSWLKEKDLPQPHPYKGNTIPEVFLNVCAHRGPYIACSDEFAGLLTYRDFKKKVYILAEHFKKIEGTYVGILLPSSVAAYVVTFALQFAGKIPAMLNWTLGPAYLDHMVEAAQIKTVFTSWNFLERLNYVDLGKMVEKIQLLEELRKDLTVKEKFRGLWFSFRSKIPLLDGNAPAVLIFTSGSEAAPKGVLLSHRNILENQRALFSWYDFKPSDSVGNFLPPFHSFGFCLAGIFALLAGIKVVFFPDPTDSAALFQGLQRWQPTLICGPPLFLKWLFESAEGKTLSSIRTIVTGGEKIPAELFNQMKTLAPNAQLLVAYGATECAPGITCTRMDTPPVGAGKAFPGVSIRILHPETHVPLQPEKEGEICVSGPNVFSGYLNSKSSPFLELEGIRWYRTGDLGYFDSNGNLIVSGRIKRFVKIGGEMISLGAIEDALGRELSDLGLADPDIPSVAVLPQNLQTSEPQLVLFTTVSLDREESNRLLKKAGLSNLIKISSVIKVDEIPRMAAGKPDYRTLAAKLTDKHIS